VIDLIVSDVMMPEMNGLEMLKQIKSHREWYKIPVIMLTALAAERDKLSALTIGVDDYLTKPFSVSELLVRAQNLLYNYQQRQQWASEEELSPLDDPETKTISDEEEQLDETKQDWIIDLTAFIRDSFDKGGLDVDELANFVHLSKRQLTRKLKEATGLTPAKFIREVQLQTALKALEDGRAISVTEVAIRSGFENLATFSTLFKQRFGKSPSAYL
jgi:DNA-binding response OmpR family regulator